MYCLYEIIELVVNTNEYFTVAMLLEIATAAADAFLGCKQFCFAVFEIEQPFLRNSISIEP